MKSVHERRTIVVSASHAAHRLLLGEEWFVVPIDDVGLLSSLDESEPPEPARSEHDDGNPEDDTHHDRGDEDDSFRADMTLRVDDSERLKTDKQATEAEQGSRATSPTRRHRQKHPQKHTSTNERHDTPPNVEEQTGHGILLSPETPRLSRCYLFIIPQVLTFCQYMCHNDHRSRRVAAKHIVDVAPTSRPERKGKKITPSCAISATPPDRLK